MSKPSEDASNAGLATLIACLFISAWLFFYLEDILKIFSN